MPIFSQTQSKVKIVFLLKHGNNHLKNWNQSKNKFINPVYYSKLNDNNKTSNQIAYKMLHSNWIKKLEVYKTSNVIIAFDNITNEKILEIRP